MSHVRATMKKRTETVTKIGTIETEGPISSPSPSPSRSSSFSSVDNRKPDESIVTVPAITKELVQDPEDGKVKAVLSSAPDAKEWRYELLPQCTDFSALLGMGNWKDPAQLTAHLLCFSVQRLMDTFFLAINRQSIEDVALCWCNYAYAPAPIPSLFVNATLYSHDLMFWHRATAVEEAMRKLKVPYSFFDHGCGTGMSLAAARSLPSPNLCRHIVGSELDVPSYRTVNVLRDAIADLPGITLVRGSTPGKANRALTDTMKIAVGDSVVLHGLKKAVSLNGLEAVVVEVPDFSRRNRSDRFVVKPRAPHRDVKSETLRVKPENLVHEGAAVILMSFADNSGQYEVGARVQRRFNGSTETGMVVRREGPIYVVKFDNTATLRAIPAQGLRRASECNPVSYPDPCASFLLHLADHPPPFQHVFLMVVGDYTPSDRPLSVAGGFTGNCAPVARTILDKLDVVPSLCWRHSLETPGTPCFTHTYDLGKLGEAAREGTREIRKKYKVGTAERKRAAEMHTLQSKRAKDLFLAGKGFAF